MPMQAHMTLTGTNQGKIEGSCDMKGREGSIFIQEMQHNVMIPRDPHSGQPTGKRVHGPLMVCKYFDKASPKLFKALCSGERFSEVEIKWYRINENGEEEHYYTHKLENAILVEIAPYMPNALEASKDQYQHMENLHFTYEKITVTWVKDGIEAMDSWKIPV